MFQEEISGSAQGERRNRGVGTEESLVVTVVAYTVSSIRVVVHKTEIIGRTSEDLGKLSKVLQALG